MSTNTQTKKVSLLTKSINLELQKLSTTSSRIRFLHSLSYTRSQIVSIISEFQQKPIRYQHVRNVLLQPLKKSN